MGVLRPEMRAINSDKYKELAISLDPKMVAVETIHKMDKNLNMSLCVPNISSSFSECVEYIRSWFKNGFASTFFLSENIAGNNIVSDFISKDREGLIKLQKPALAITPDLDTSFDRDGYNAYYLGINTYYNGFRYQDSFFRDLTKKSFISICLDQILVKFNIKIRLSSKASAIDVLQYIKMRYFVGASRTYWNDIDYHVSKPLLLRLAKDTGFEIKNGEVSDIGEFLKYLNSHSAVPFMYKFRQQKAKFEYFIKVPDQCIYVRTNEVTMDDGDRENQLDNNYVVTLDCECRFPCPKFYAYYSINKYDKIIAPTTDGGYNMYNFVLCDIPAVNSRGWQNMASWDWEEDEDVFKLKLPSEIDMKPPLIELDSGRILDIIKDLRDQMISPASILEFKVYNFNNPVDVTVDWENLLIVSKTILPSRVSHIVLYCNLDAINEIKVSKKKYIASRMNVSDQSEKHPGLS